MKTIHLNSEDKECDVCGQNATTRIVLEKYEGYSCKEHIYQVSRQLRYQLKFRDLWK